MPEVFLSDDRVDRHCCFTSLTVTNDQLTLTTAYWDASYLLIYNQFVQVDLLIDANITPGATFSTASVNFASIGPLPSIGLPKASTTRPKSSGPTGTSNTRPVQRAF